MAMTETFAATAAQTIPVFALAGVIEARAAIRTGWPHATPATDTDTERARRYLLRRGFIKSFTLIAWSGIGGVNLFAEWQCLNFLRSGHAAEGADGLVADTMMLSLLVLVIFPLIAVANRAANKTFALAEDLREHRTSREATDGHPSDP